jgi:membrane protease YdiL (CAAX protease family)
MSIILRYPLIAYFAIAFGISWGGIFLVLTAVDFRPASVTLLAQGFMFLAMVAGPSISGLVSISVNSPSGGLRELWSRMIMWRVDMRWNAIALLSVPILLSTVLWTLSIAISPNYAPQFLWQGLIVAFLAGALEEIGWSGFVTPRFLARYRWFITGLILGGIWALWHLLVAIFASGIVAPWPSWLLWFGIFWFLALIAYRILMTWVYTHTKSVLVAQLMHAAYTGSLVVMSPQVSFAQGLLWQTIFVTGLWAIVAIVAFIGSRPIKSCR